MACVFGSIDCAGILKLRNADIELRKGETDIGRKNTRVRLVFRVHIPESSGRIISLQAASNPIECCKYPEICWEAAGVCGRGRVCIVLFVQEWSAEWRCSQNSLSASWWWRLGIQTWVGSRLCDGSTDEMECRLGLEAWAHPGCCLFWAIMLLGCVLLVRLQLKQGKPRLFWYSPERQKKTQFWFLGAYSISV